VFLGTVVDEEPRSGAAPMVLSASVNRPGSGLFRQQPGHAVEAVVEVAGPMAVLRMASACGSGAFLSSGQSECGCGGEVQLYVQVESGSCDTTHRLRLVVSRSTRIFPGEVAVETPTSTGCGGLPRSYRVRYRQYRSAELVGVQTAMTRVR